MSLLSTLRPLPQRLLERLWLILSGYVPTSIEYHMTMNALNDDCLLILLDTLTMSQLLQLRGVSRRFCKLIERQSLRKFKTLIFCYEENSSELTGEEMFHFYFGSRRDAEREFGVSTLFAWYWKETLFQASKLVSLRSNAWPLSLPLLLPRLSSLSLTHFLVDQFEAPTEEQLAVNRRFVPYLNSNWSKTLTTLHLIINVPFRPMPDNSFAQLNQLTNLKHLFIYFSQLPKSKSSSFLLPDSMPVLGQLLSFALENYAASNMATLLHQLGPDLSFLVLDDVNCSEDDCVAFLRARPNYARTLKTFHVSLKKMNWELFTMATQSLPSLKLFAYCLFTVPARELDSIFTNLSYLQNLEYIHLVPVFVAQLRALNLRQHMQGTLPRLTSIRQANISIFTNGVPFQPSEVFDHLLPLLSRIFCRLECLIIYFNAGSRRDKALGEQLSTKVRQLFPALGHLEANYYIA